MPCINVLNNQEPSHTSNTYKYVRGREKSNKSCQVSLMFTNNIIFDTYLNCPFYGEKQACSCFPLESKYISVESNQTILVEIFLSH